MTSANLSGPWQLILAFLVILIVMGLLAVVMSQLNLSNHPYALGLPSGSIRAVLALSLVFIFTASSLMMLSSDQLKPSRAKISDFTDLSLTDVQVLQENSKFSVITTSRKGPDREILYSGSIFESETSSAQVDIAKQILTALISVLSVVTGFYFGNRAATSPAETISISPTLDKGDTEEKRLNDKVKGRSNRINSTFIKLKEQVDKINDSDLKPLATDILSNAVKQKSAATELEKMAQQIAKELAQTSDTATKATAQARFTDIVNKFERVDAKLLEFLKQITLFTTK
jgi:hypothetical protein